MTQHTINPEAVLRAAPGGVERELEVVGRRWALKLRPRGLVSCRFPHVSLCEHSERECLPIHDLPSVLRCLPTRVAENAGRWLPVLQALSDAIDFVGVGADGDDALLDRLESVAFEPLSWLGSYGNEREIPTAACFAAEAVATDGYSMELRDGRFLGLRVSRGKAAATEPTRTADVDRGVVDALRDLRAGPRRAGQAGPQPRSISEAIAEPTSTDTLVHDLKNVLTVVVGHLELEERRGRLAAVRALDAARLGVDIADRFLERGRSASSAASSTPPSAPAAISVSSVVADVLGLLAGALDDGVEVVSALDSDLAPVPVDPCALHSALLDLLLNARDAVCGSGRIVVSARMLSRGDAQAGRCVEIAVTDDGIAMPRNAGERVVEPFATTGNSPRSPGVGLTQVRDFVERCGGCVRIDRRKRGGTRVRMQLPTLSCERGPAGIGGRFDARISA